MTKIQITKAPTDTFSHPGIRVGEHGNYVNHTIGGTERNNADLEAEGGETLLTSLNNDTLPEFYTIKGKRHSQGGVPLKVPDKTFFFSDTKEMKISDPETLAMFGYHGKKSVTPADISKKYDINKYREILADPNSTKLEKNTAELMIKNCKEKLAKLALVQESKKGFPDGIPEVAQDYMKINNIDENKINPSIEEMAGVKYNPFSMPEGDAQESPEQGEEMAKYGKEYSKKKYKVQVFLPQRKGGGPGIGNAMKSYRLMYQKLQDPKFRAEFVKNMRAELEAAKEDSKTKLTKKEIDEAKGFTDDQLVNNFLNNLYRNYAFAENKAGIDDSWDDGTGRANAWAKANGASEMNMAMTAAFQAGYKGLYSMSQNKAMADYFKDMKLIQTGPSGDGHTFDGSRISVVDGSAGDNTSRQVVALKDDSDLTPEEKKQKEEEERLKHLKEQAKDFKTGYGTPEMVQLAQNIRDRLNVKKYNPWEPDVDIQYQDPNFVDYRGTASRQRALANGAITSNNIFSGPQSRAANYQQVQEALGDQLMNAQENAISQNVGIANEVAARNNDTANKYGLERRNGKIHLYDNQVYTNEDYDNTKRALDWNVVNGFVNAWDSRTKARGINALNENVKFDPIRGDYVVIPGGDIKPINPEKTFSDRIDHWYSLTKDYDTAMRLTQGELQMKQDEQNRTDKKEKDKTITMPEASNVGPYSN